MKNMDNQEIWELIRKLRIPKNDPQVTQQAEQEAGVRREYPLNQQELESQLGRAQRLAKVNAARPAALNPFQSEKWADYATPGYK